ncbi:MAG: addiction module protein [Rhodanobacteraceae bacterium]|jgi:hypothetical protein|nr:addiction module protein [Rhodanobacteraceae bacterium]
MSESAKNLLLQAIRLPAADRAGLADELLESLHAPDAAIDAAWLREAEARMAAFHRGELEAIDAGQVFAELGKPV